MSIWQPDFFTTKPQSGAIAQYLSTLPKAPIFKTDFLNYPEFNPALALFECLRYGDNGSYHFTHNYLERGKVISQFLQPIIDKRKTGCLPLAVQSKTSNTFRWKIMPNPLREHLQIYVEQAPAVPVEIALLTIDGQILRSKQKQLFDGIQTIFEIDFLTEGFYFVRIYDRKTTSTLRAMIIRD